MAAFPNQMIYQSENKPNKYIPVEKIVSMVINMLPSVIRSSLVFTAHHRILKSSFFPISVYFICDGAAFIPIYIEYVIFAYTETIESVEHLLWFSTCVAKIIPLITENSNVIGMNKLFV